MRSTLIKLNGEPFTWRNKGHMGFTKYYELHNELKIKFLVALQSQFDDEPFTRPVHIDVQFCFKPKISEARQTWCAHDPSLQDCIRWLITNLKPTVLTDYNICCKMTAMKLFDTNPCTILKISEIL